MRFELFCQFWVNPALCFQFLTGAVCHCYKKKLCHVYLVGIFAHMGSQKHVIKPNQSPYLY